ncbi:MAG: DUF4345 family protein [Pararhodobacter sp.]
MTIAGARFQTIVLGLYGLVLIALGANVALGGVETLGLQFPPAGLSAADPVAFQRHDNNVRFLGGFFAGAGIVIALSAVMASLRPTAAVLLLMLFLGGLARLLQPGYAVLADPVFYVSLLAELLLAPLFALWLWQSGPGAALRLKDGSGVVG